MSIIKCSECGNAASTTAKQCPTCGAKRFKPTNKLHLALAAVMVIALVAGFSGHLAPKPHPQISSVPTNTPAAAKPAPPPPCDKDVNLFTNYNNYIKLGKFADAASSLRPCAKATQSAELLGLIRSAESSQLAIIATNDSIDASLRLDALNRLREIDPEKAAKFEILAAKLPTIINQEMERNRRIDAERRRMNGPAIGMTKDEVLMSSWGKPDRINTTTSTFNKREQWVYRVRLNGYLYFEGDRLVTIQN